MYPGGSLDARVNACIADAEKGANGATSHICSSEGEAVTGLIFSTITVGDTSSDEVTWVLPSVCNWEILPSANFTGTQAGILQYSGTNIVGRDGKYGCLFQNFAGASALYAVYETAPTSLYVRASGFNIANKVNPTASGAAMLINGGVDTSYFQDIEVQQYLPNGPAIQIGGTGKPCCSISLNRITAFGNNVGGTLLSIVSTGGSPNGVSINNSSLGHPAAGKPVFSCTDTGYQATVVSFTNLYEEGTNGDNTTALNRVSGCREIHVSGMEMKVEQGHATAPGWILNGNEHTSFDIHGLSMLLGFQLPAIAVENNLTGSCAEPPCNVMTDRLGNLAGYSTGSEWADVVNVLGGYEVNGAPLSFADVAGTISVPGQVPLATNSAAGAMRGDGTSISCVAGVCSSLQGGAGTVTGSGSPGVIPLWNNAVNQTNSALSDNGMVVSSSEPLSVMGNVTATGTLVAGQISSPLIVGSALHAGSCLATYTGGTIGTAAGWCQVASTATVPFTSTPVLNKNVGSSRILVAGNITTFTLPAGSDGQHACLNFVHDATANVYTVTPPSNVLGFFTIGSAPNGHNLQCFTYFQADNAWIAESSGVINQ
jgi:hypothetical protein